MKLAKIIGSVGLLLVLVLFAGVAYFAVYLNSHKGLLEAAASRALGRQIKVEDRVTMVWSMPPQIGLDGVWIANPTWAQGGYFARAERIAAKVDVWALLRGRVEIRRMTLLGAEVDLETGPEGQANWTFAVGAHGGMGFQIDSLQVRGSSLRYRPASGTQHALEISELELQGLGGETLGLQAEVRLRGAAVTVSASSGPFVGEGWPFTIRLQTGEATLDASGRAVAPFVLSGMKAELEAQGQSLQQLQDVLGLGDLPAGSFHIQSEMTASAEEYHFQGIQGTVDVPGWIERITLSQGDASFAEDGPRALSLEGSWRKSPASLSLSFQQADQPSAKAGRQMDLSARLGETELKGELGLVLSGPRPRITGTLSASRVNLSDFPGVEQAVDGRAGWRDLSLPRDLLGALDLDVNLKAQAVVSERLRLDGFHARVRLDDGNLQVDGLDVSLPGLRVTGQVTLDTRSEPSVLDAELRSRRIDLPQAVQGRLPPDRLQGSLREVSARLESGGTTLGALMANIRGTLDVGSARVTLPGQPATHVVLDRPRVSVAPGAPLALRTGLTFRENSFDIQGTLGQLSDLLAGSGVAVDLRLRQHELRAHLDGNLATLDGLAGSRFAVTVSAPSLVLLGPFFEIELPESQPFEFTGRLEAGTGSLDLKQIQLSSGGSDIQGEVRVISGSKMRVEATLESRLLDASPYLPAQGASPADALTALENELPLDLLHGLDGVLRLKASHLRLGDLGLNELRLDASLDAGHLRLNMMAGEERLLGDVELKPEETRWRLTLKHKGKLNLSSLLETVRAADEADEAPLAIDLHLSGVGRSPHELLASADGHLEMVVGEGRINKKLGTLLPLGDMLVALLNTIGSTAPDEPYTSVECAVVRLDAANGFATSAQGVALRTDTLNVLGGGAVNLSTGEIEFHFKTAQRKGLGFDVVGIADKLIYFTGTLWQPQAVVDPKGILIHGAAAWATGGLSVLYTGLANRLTAFSNPCDTVLKQSAK